ncbi:iron uptake porin [Geminocystis herdmanii]|uniref:iron uptake porin n=1 Tax=Geminocystis herdmanii TaxID=669359 RepID=UPI001181C230|nr:iron uptake porin [Geminocystis herdmanii]
MMNKLKYLLFLAVIFNISNFFVSNTAKAQSIIDSETMAYDSDNNVMNQINSVSQLRDVSPTDWAFEALRSLVERYGCIVGYPDRTFRGNRAMSRYEFAAGLNACLNSIEKLIQQGSIVVQEDLEKLKKLATEYETELATLNTRVNNLDGRITFLEEHNFSTTTTLRGENIIVFSGVGGNETAALGAPKGTPITDGQITANYRTRLDLNTSFSGEDLLKVRLQMGNFYFARGGSNLTDFNFSAGGENNTSLNKVQYSFPVGDRVKLYLAGIKITLDDISDPLSPYTSDFATGSVAFFPSLAPIYLMNDYEGPGVGAYFDITDKLNLGILYSALNGSNPESGNGLFNGKYNIATQLTYNISANTGIAFAYAKDYSGTGDLQDFSLLGYTGVANTDDPFDGNATSSDHYAVIGSWQISPRFNVSGWGMYTNSKAEGGARRGDYADIWNWKVSLAFPDLFKEGNLGAVSVGSPPYAGTLTNKNNIPTDVVATKDTPFLIETFYVFKLTDNISVTPAFWVGINPANDRDPLYVGALRTAFTF